MEASECPGLGNDNEPLPASAPAAVPEPLPSPELEPAAVHQSGPLFQRTKEDFECEHCGHLQRGTGYTNHCGSCLWSKHVDVNPGDRAATCHGLMQPVAVDTKKAGYRILQRCLGEGCGHERWNKAQDGDDFDAILRISALCVEMEPPQSSRGGGKAKGRRQGGGKDARRGKHTSKGGRKKCLMKGRR